jgi:TPR repeat protein
MDALGRIFFDGEDLEKPDHARGISWYERCVQNGPAEFFVLLNGGKDPALASAQGALGQIYRHGIGIDQNHQRGLELLKLSAEGGNVCGMNNLGTFFAVELDDFEQAFAWYKASAELGYALAMANVGEFLRLGKGHPKDLDGAEKWLSKAIAKGCPQAIEFLARVKLEAGDYEGEVQQLEDALKVEQKNGEVQVVTLAYTAQQFLQLQSNEDDNLSIEDLYRLLRNLGNGAALSSSSSHEMDAKIFLQHRNDMCRRFQKLRPITEREERARTLWDQAVQLGHAQSGIQHAEFILQKGMDAEALRILRHTASYLNDAEAHYLAGLLLLGLKGSGSVVDEAKGASSLRKASKLGHEGATSILNDRMDQKESQTRTQQSTETDLAARQEHARGFLDATYKEIQAGGHMNKKELNAYKSMNDSWLQGMADPDALNKGLKPGTAADHMGTLIDYTALHPKSLNAQSMLHAYNHYLLFHATWPTGGPDLMILEAMTTAVNHLFLAYSFDEKAVSVAYHVKQDGSGTPTPAGVYAKVAMFAEGMLEWNPNDFKYIMIKCYLNLNTLPLDDLSKAVAIGESGADPLAVRLLPRVLHLRGSILCFRKRQFDALRDFQRALHLLENNKQTSEFPYDVDASSDVLASLRHTMILNAKLSIAHAALAVHKIHPAKKLCKPYFDEYLEGAPEDDHL